MASVSYKRTNNIYLYIHILQKILQEFYIYLYTKYLAKSICVSTYTYGYHTHVSYLQNKGNNDSNKQLNKNISTGKSWSHYHNKS